MNGSVVKNRAREYTGILFLCDGKRFAALTRENGALVVRGYLVGVGDVAWKTNPLADRDYLGFLAGAGWVLRDTKQDRVTLLRG